MFFSIPSICGRRFQPKPRPINRPRGLLHDNEKTSHEFRPQKYLSGHYMIWKIDCFPSSRPESAGPTSSFIFENINFPSLHRISLAASVCMRGYRRFQTKKVGLRLFISPSPFGFKVIFCATIVHPKEGGQLRRRTPRCGHRRHHCYLAVSMANSCREGKTIFRLHSHDDREEKTFLNTSAPPRWWWLL